MITEKMLGILLIVFMVYTHTSDALNCIVCSGDTAPGCNVPFDKAAKTSDACPKPECSAALFRKADKSSSVVVRGCGPPKELAAPAGYEAVENADYSCQEDDCNEKDDKLEEGGGGGGGGGGGDEGGASTTGHPPKGKRTTKRKPVGPSKKDKTSTASLTNKPFILLCYLSPVYLKYFN